jgi:hypothetical protein
MSVLSGVIAGFERSDNMLTRRTCSSVRRSARCRPTGLSPKVCVGRPEHTAHGLQRPSVKTPPLWAGEKSGLSSAGKPRLGKGNPNREVDPYMGIQPMACNAPSAKTPPCGQGKRASASRSENLASARENRIERVSVQETQNSLVKRAVHIIASL